MTTADHLSAMTNPLVLRGLVVQAFSWREGSVRGVSDAASLVGEGDRTRPLSTRPGRRTTRNDQPGHHLMGFLVSEEDGGLSGTGLPPRTAAGPMSRYLHSEAWGPSPSHRSRPPLRRRLRGLVRAFPLAQEQAKPFGSDCPGFPPGFPSHSSGPNQRFRPGRQAAAVVQPAGVLHGATPTTPRTARRTTRNTQPNHHLKGPSRQ